MIPLQADGGMMPLLNSMLLEFMQTLPKLTKALVILILGWIIAKFVSGLVRKILAKTPSDNLAKKLNEIELVANTGMEIVPSKVLSKILYYLLMLLFIVAATEVLDMPAISELMVSIIDFLPRLITAGILLLIGIFVADFIKGIVSTVCTSLGIPSTKMIAGFVFWFFY